MTSGGGASNTIHICILITNDQKFQKFLYHQTNGTEAWLSRDGGHVIMGQGNIVKRAAVYPSLCPDISIHENIYRYIYFSQKQLPREMESRLVIIVCAGYIFWQLFLLRLQLYLSLLTAPKKGECFFKNTNWKSKISLGKIQ